MSVAAGKLRLCVKRKLLPRREQGRRQIDGTLSELQKKKPEFLPGDDPPVRKQSDIHAT